MNNLWWWYSIFSSLPRDWWHLCLLHIRNILTQPLFDNFKLAKSNSHTNYQVKTIFNVEAHSFFINGSQISQTQYKDITIYNVEAHSCFYKWQPWEEPGFVMCQLWNLYGGSGGISFKHSQLSDTKCQSLLFQILEFPQWSFQKTPNFLLFVAIIICSSITS